MLAEIFHAPLMAIRAYRGVLREQATLRREFPNGGRCQLCGEETPPNERECTVCMLAGPL
jgi:hypothetical protein